MSDDEKLERILSGKPELAHTLEQVKQEATRRAVGSGYDHIVCMNSDGVLCVRVGRDYLKDQGELTPLVYCFPNGNRQNIKQKGTK